ncbi:MAG: hypothetical protein IJ094_12185 [Bacilli bacterium]|nr:hypothetical protein [Bacilli bacterium]
MKRRGISLIVLVVTIIVIIILAAVVILTISKNNPIESAKEATFKEDVRTFQDELAMYISKDYVNKAGARDDKITETDSSKIKDYIPSFSKKYEGKFVIKNDELMYKEEMIQQEKEWCQSLNVKENAKTGAEKAKEDPQNYYGAKVDYKTGNENIDNDISEWKIFYSDGSNVYIISLDYASLDNLPSKDGEKPSKGDNKNCLKAAKFNEPLLTKYNKGSECIKDDKIRDLNYDYYSKGYISGENENMKAVAYMLDKDIWTSLYSNKTVAEYAVGGPSIEMLMKSYSEKKGVDYRAKAVSKTGYQISNNGGKSWADNYNIMLNANDDLYVLPQNKGAFVTWLSSPGANGIITHITSQGHVNSFGFNYTASGFRPLVCLNSNISLNWNEQDQIYEIK